MKRKINKDYLVLILGVSFLVLVDRVVKVIVVNSGIEYQINTGISFSLLDYPFIPYVISILALIVVFFLWKSSENKVPLVIIMAGGLSNLIDRFEYGGVVDYISIGNFPVFNLADLYINIGLVLFIGATLWQYYKKREK